MRMYIKTSSLTIQIPEDPVEPEKKKVCTGCHQSFDIDSDHFHKDPYRRDGWDIYCKECRSRMKKQYNSQIKQHNMEKSNA